MYEKSVLVVDDEPALAGMIQRLLETEGYKVVTAFDGEQGLQRFYENAGFDLVISDVLMPNLNGPDMLREMLREVPDLKAIFITGYTDETVNARISELRFEVIRKPFTPEHFLARVRETVR